MNSALWLHRSGLSHAAMPAAASGTRVVMTYGQLAERAARIAGSLRDRFKLNPGDRVAIAAKNSPDYLALLYGIWHAGLAAVPANAKLHGAELGYILEHSGARVCFASPGIDAEIAPHAPKSLERLIAIGSADYNLLLTADATDVVPRAGSDLAWLFYTSGTTGKPKGAMLTHRNLNIASHAYAAEVDSVSPGDAILHAAPMSHGSGLYIMQHVARLGVQVVPESGGFEPDEVFALIDHWPRLSMFAAPTMIKRLVDAPGGCNVENIRTLIWGGAPMYVEDCLRALDRFGPRLAQIYGQGESPMTITTLTKQDIADRDHPRWRERLASCGKPYACVEVMVADADDKPVAAGETGEILVRGDVVMAGYWQNEEATAASLRGGFLHTGDVGAFDAEGYLTLKDRSKDLIISGGSNIYPREVEEVLLTHKAVREVSVIGRPDADWGEAVVAYVVGDVPRAELDALCLSHIARFKRPKDYVFVDALPKNNYGKILKTELRAQDAQRVKGMVP
ncbi:MAG: AMP-binding protein [Pseudolabrys sp.]|nr:AMP-binding protein [Pseudolabrys sp.]MDP2298304.1 AMP-binding protein [Pseudolabrys sp.]